ncbi:MAG TPA: hypothetical protein VL916_05550, partial [Ilumatobacteraceae bacterium]|nr:hypothetical protein [Ilumatobacteraceae bacterium]
SSSSSTAVTTTIDDDATSTSVTMAALAPSTSVRVSDPGLIARDRSHSSDATSTSVANTVDDDDDDDNSTSTSVANTIDDDDDDDNTSTSVANTIDDDDDNSTSTSVATTNAPAAPAPFTQTYSSAGGSITVTWNGSSLSLDSINANAGFVGEIEDGGGSRVRVDFESNGGSGGDDARIEVRVEGGRLEVRVD